MLPYTQVRNVPVPSESNSGLHGSVRFVVAEFEHGCACGIERHSFGLRLVSAPLNAGIGRYPTIQRPDRNRMHPHWRRHYCGCNCWARETRNRRLHRRIRRCAAVAASRREITRPFSTQREVVFEHIETFGAVLGNNSGSASVVNNVIAYQAVMAVVNRYSPLRRSINRIADKCELIPFAGVSWDRNRGGSESRNGRFGWCQI